MNTLTRTVQRRITADWLGMFPEFAIYRPLWILRRAGPVVQGVCLERDSGNRTYLPTSHIHILCRAFPTVTLEMAQPLRTSRTGAADRISVERHAGVFEESAKKLKAQCLLPCDRGFSVAEVLDALARYAKLSETGSGSLRLLESRLLLSIWAGRARDARAMLQELAAEAQRRPQAFAARMGGIDGWIGSLAEAIDKPDQLEGVVRQQIVALDLESIPNASG